MWCVVVGDGVLGRVWQDYAQELVYLKQKVDAGADFITTQVL